jgi:chemotaxis regulatin CheY-phosphate phosphatase CheZ
MAELRKRFRIEATAAAQFPRNGSPAQAPLPRGEPSDLHHDLHRDSRHAEIMQALGTLATVIAAPRAKADVPANDEDDKFTRRAAQLARIADELDAVRAGSAEATQKILNAAEEIDQLANTLSAALRGKLEQDLAQDVTDLVIRIFEACNFQDMIGQRITKVTATLNAIENQAEHATASPSSAPEDAAQFLHGPRLAKDPGHMDQSEIDALFGD